MTIITTDLAFPNPTVQPVYIEGVPCQVIYNHTKSINGVTWDSRDDYPNDIDVSNFHEMVVYLGVGTVVGGTSPTVTLYITTVFDDGSVNKVTFDMADSGAVPQLTNKFLSVGPGLAFAQSIGQRLRFEMTAAGSPTQVNFIIIAIAKG